MTICYVRTESILQTCVFKKGSCQLLAKVCARSTGKPLRRSKPAQEKLS